MSVFRIQRKKFQNDVRQKIHSEESKPTFKISKNIAQILNQAQQKMKFNVSFKRRVNTNPAKDQYFDMNRIKRISQTYNVTKAKIQNCKKTKFSKKSLSGTKIDAILNASKNFQFFQSKQKSLNKSSPKITKKKSQDLRIGQKSKGKISNRFTKEISASKFYFPQHLTKRQMKTNRIMPYELTQRVKDLFSEGLHYYRKKNIVRALDLFLECIKLESLNTDCLYHIGSCYLNLKESKLSLQFLQKLRRISPSYNKNLYLYLAINYKHLNMESESIKVLLEGIKYFPQFQEGLFYLGKMYMRQQNYSNAAFALQRCISLNRQNILATLILADTYILNNQQQKSLELLKKILSQKSNKNLDIQTQLSTHLKLIQLLISIQQYHDPLITTSINFLESHVPNSPELQFFKFVIVYQTKTQITPIEIQSIKFTLDSCLKDIQSESLKIQCFKFILRILIDTKDLYQAEDLLKFQQLIKENEKHLILWKLFIEASNDIIKRKFEEGKTKLISCLQKVSVHNPNKNSKFAASSARAIKINFKDFFYLKHQILEYLAYVQFEELNFNGALNIYKQILQNDLFCQNYDSVKEIEKLQIERYRKRYSNKFKEIQVNKILVESIKQHLQKQNYFQAKKGFQLALNQRQTPERFFMWIINEVAILRCQQLFQTNKIDEFYLKSKNNWPDVINKLTMAQQISPNFSLIYFYHSLILLYFRESRQALNKVEKAIQKIEEPISQFHYIQGLCYFLVSEQDNNMDLAYLGLEAMDKAIEIDSGIPQFFKQRSKHLFCLGKYEEGIKDCLRCELQNNDSEAKLLSMFYHYLCGNYYQSQNLMCELLYNNEKKPQRQNDNQSQRVNAKAFQDEFDHRYKQFEQGLMFRLKKYQRTGVVGRLLESLTGSNDKDKDTIKELDFDYLNRLYEVLDNRECYSQFTVYLIGLLVGGYFFYRGDYHTCLNYLFTCLQEIQVSDDEQYKSRMQGMKENESFKIEENNSQQYLNKKSQAIESYDELMLSEIKYNIVIASLFKEYQQLQHYRKDHNQKKIQQQQAFIEIQKSYSSTLNFIDTFVSQSQSKQLNQHLTTIKQLILSSQKVLKNTQQQILTSSPQEKQIFFHQNKISVCIKPYFQTQKLSDQFPDIQIPIGHKYLLVTKFIVFYPPKLKFNIKPQFDPSFLFNFWIDKIDNKITPPWFKFTSNTSGKPTNTMIFTNELRNQSLAFTSTQKQLSTVQKQKQFQHRYRYFNESIKKVPITKSMNQTEQRDFLKLMKLDSKVEKKLQKLFPK